MRYEVCFHDGPMSNRKTRIILEAENTDECWEKIYNRPEAKQYSDVIFGEYIEGPCAYMVAFVTESFCDKKRTPRSDREDGILVDAENEEQARRYYLRNYMGKYVNSHIYHESDELLNDEPDGYQHIRLGKILDVYQCGKANDSHRKAY